jgi:hypothetical protein
VGDASSPADARRLNEGVGRRCWHVCGHRRNRVRVMGAISINRRVDRDSGVAGFGRQNRVSTDALNALNEWKDRGNHRSYTVVDGYEANDYLVARLSTEQEDANAGADLDGLCFQHGVCRQAQD